MRDGKVLSMLIIGAVVHGQDVEPSIRTETRLALVRFHTVQKNLYVEDIKAEDIQPLEDGKPHKLALFEGPKTAGWQRQTPFDVSLSAIDQNLLDTFFSKRPCSTAWAAA